MAQNEVKADIPLANIKYCLIKKRYKNKQYKIAYKNSVRQTLKLIIHILVVDKHHEKVGYRQNTHTPTKTHIYTHADTMET